MSGEIMVSGASEEEAVEEAIERLGMPREAVECEVELQSEDELLPGAKPEVQVRAWIKLDWVAERAERRLREILDIMGVEYELDVEAENRVIHLNVRAGEDSSLLIGRDGQNLAAVQYLINRMILPSGREAPMILIDVENYRRNQYRQLERLVQRAVQRARETGNEIELDPMMPATRKYLHNYLREFDGVKTFSRGEEPERYLVIIAD